MGRLVVYTTSHGYGHLNRTVAVLNRIPTDVPITIRCAPNLFPHWSERLRRPADLEAFTCDSGAVNPPGDSAATDGPATIDLAIRVHTEAIARVEEEAQRLVDLGAAAILCDVPAPPFLAATRAGVPSFALANFTWAEIYDEYAPAAGEPGLRLLDELRRAYRQATAAFRAEPALPLHDFPHRIDVGMVVTPGRDRRGELRARFDIGPREKLVYVYVGRYGQAQLNWGRLAEFRGYHFVGFHPLPGVAPENYHIVPPDEWTGADLAASADVALAKAGYGTVCETMAAGTPLIYPPRTGFAEHAALDRALRAWGGGLPLTEREFTAMDLANHLERAAQRRPGTPPFRADGAARVAEYLARACRAGLASPTPRTTP